MRVHLKKELLNTLELVYSAQNQVKQPKTEQDVNNARLILNSCMQGMVKVAEAIEASGEEHTAVISGTNAYCKELFSVANDFGIETFTEQSVDKLNSLLNTVKDEIKSIKPKIRVLFVAELAGKWDSMDSVYKAMIKRDDVDVDVVLEPIFRAIDLPNGEHRQDIIYVDYLAPMGIKHILYKDYDMSKIRPDITFLCQPYESVTIPMFWPENIVKYSRLVYLTYGSAYSLHPDIQPAFDQFFRFNTERMSWKIPCQSDRMLEHYKKNGTQKGRNVIVTGIAKWDYPVNLTKENTPCPKEWKSVIKNRKVFLWNTHFAMSKPENGSQFLTPKGLDFLKIFMENNDIALIWRPHPMTEPVLKVYSPNLLGIYYGMMELVNRADNMIMDTNERYAPAFVWSDALISDISTMIDQYLLQKKPVLVNLREKDIISKFESCKQDGLLNFMALPMAFSIDDIRGFIENVKNGDTDYTETYQRDFGEYYQYADGHAGERIVDTVIEKFIEEESAVMEVE